MIDTKRVEYFSKQAKRLEKSAKRLLAHWEKIDAPRFKGGSKLVDLMVSVSEDARFLAFEIDEELHYSKEERRERRE